MNAFLNEIVSNEFISHQRGYRLKNQMVAIIEPYMGLKGNTFEIFNKTPLPKIIKNFTGLNINFSDTEDSDPDGAYTLPPAIKTDNIFIRDKVFAGYSDEELKGYLNNSFDKLKGLNVKMSGLVNPHTSKVSGVFSELLCVIAMGKDYLSKKIYTTEEVVAIILHEMGHLFCYYMYIADVTRTNIVLSVLNRSGYFQSDKNIKVKILEKLEKDLDYEIPEKEQMTTMDENGTYMVVIAQHLRKNRSELNTPLYDERTFEFLSDQFSTMHGAGAALVTGLHKTYKKYGVVVKKDHYNIMSSVNRFVVLLVKYSGVLGPFTLLAWFNMLGGFSSLKTSPDLYDDSMTRHRKVKEQLIGKLKQRNLSKIEKSTILNDIETIDIILRTYQEAKDPLELAFYKSIMSWYRKKESVAKLNHDYESLVYNPFFHQSAKLS